MEAHEAKNCTYILASAAGGLIEALGMHAENQDRLSKGQTIAYDYAAFQETINKYGLHHNSIMSNLYPS